MAGLPASEFGGRVQRNGVQPPPHTPTASERLGLIYRTGDETGTLPLDNEGVIMSGLNPRKVQEQIRQQAGDLNKGEVWEEILQRGGAA
jgi:hypothetical protein